MYNRYLAAANSEPLPPDDPPHPADSRPAGALTGLGRGLSDRLHNVKLDMDTVIVLALVWFLLADDGDGVDWEQLILIGVLLVLGI
ncbi:MAG: hypothetical protein Q4D31_00965 [Eubacteriales bacterium]|nr:hypothetical protein [Eubacteriales bacterium]